MFHDTKANDRYGKSVSSMCQARDICMLAAPYAPAGVPVKIDLGKKCQYQPSYVDEAGGETYMKHVVSVATHLYVCSAPVEPAQHIIQP